MKPQDKKIFKERIKSFFPQATPSGVEQLMSLLINCCCIDLCSINNADDIQFTAMGVTGDTLSVTLTINGTPVTQSVTLPSDINTIITDTVIGHLIANYTNETGVVTPINETITGLGTPTLVNNILTIPFNNEAGDTVNVSVDLSVLSSDINIQGIVYDDATNTWIITQTDGSTSTITWNDILTDVDFCPAVKACETISTLVDNGDGTYTYTNEAGNSTVIAMLTTQDLTIGGVLFTTGTSIQTILSALATLAHVPVTTVDSGSINFVQSGTDNQTITAEISGIATATIGQIPVTDGSGNIVWSTVAGAAADNGLSVNSGVIELGGILYKDTLIEDTTNNTNSLLIGTTTPLNSFKVTTETENLVKTSINDYDAYLRTMSNYNRLEVSSPINPEIARVDTTAVVGQATTNVSATDGTDTAQTNYNAQSGNTYVQTIVTDGTNTNTFRITPLTLQSEIHPNLRDDTATETPINFLYTNGIGEILSAPVGQGTAGFWALTGNGGTDGGLTNFLGTTDTQDLVLKTNNTSIASFSGDNNFRISIGDAPSNIVSGLYTISIGNTNYTIGSSSMTIGEGNETNGDHSMAIGTGAVANGSHSFSVQGGGAEGDYSFAFGTSSLSYKEFSFGQFPVSYSANITAWDNNDRLLNIGNGSLLAQHNALTLWKDGRAMMNTGALNTSPIQNTWFGINGTLAQNFNHIRTDNTFAGFSAEHTPSGKYVILGATAGNVGTAIRNTDQFAFTVTAGTSSTALSATTTVGNYSSTGFTFGDGSMATSTISVNGTLGLSNTRINTANPVLNTNNVIFHFTGGASGTVDLTAHKVDNRLITLTNYSGVTLTLSDPVRTGSATTTTSLPNNVSVMLSYDGIEFFKIN